MDFRWEITNRLRVCWEKESLRAMNPFQRQLQLSDFKESVTLFRDMIIFFAVTSYFLGWVYLNEYLSHFGLYLANLSIPFYYYFIFSCPPLLEAIGNPTWSDGFRLLVLTMSIFACVAGYKVRLMAGYFAVAACFLCILFISFQIALEKSQYHANFVLDGGGKVISFVFTQDVKKTYGELIGSTLLAANKDNRLRLVWRTDKEVYAVDVSCVHSIKPTYRIPVSSFVFSRVFGNTSALE